MPSRRSVKFRSAAVFFGSRTRNTTCPCTVTAWKSAVTCSNMKPCSSAAIGTATTEVVGAKYGKDSPSPSRTTWPPRNCSTYCVGSDFTNSNPSMVVSLPVPLNSGPVPLS